MNILIDFTQIPKNKGGVGVYALNLIRQLLELDHHNHYYILIQNDEHCFDDLLDVQCRLIRFNHRIFRRFIFRVIIEQVLMPILIKTKSIDLVHSIHYTFPFISFGAKRVVTIHDMTFFLHPHLHVGTKRIYFRFFLKQTALRADAIIAVSKSTKNDFLRLTGENKRVTVIPLGRPSGSMRRLIKSIDPADTFSRFGIHHPYFLYVGALEPRKNIQLIISAFGKISSERPRMQLVIAGAKGWDYEKIFQTARLLRVQNKILFLGYITDTEKHCLMAHATGFIYPSLYEGFGLPVLEAMSMGAPTITSNRSSMPEISGRAAILINPEDESQLLFGMNALKESKKVRAALKARGLRQSSLFRWKSTAQSTINLYHRIFNGTVRDH